MSSSSEDEIDEDHENDEDRAAKIAKMSLTNLKDECGRLGLTKNGNKRDLVDRILKKQERRYWQSTQGRDGLAKGMDSQKLFEVGLGTREYDSIASLFYITLHKSIDKIERIEIGYVHEAYRLKRDAIKSQLGAVFDAAQMKQKLFHGTKAIEEIVNSTDGSAFQPLLSGTSTGAVCVCAHMWTVMCVHVRAGKFTCTSTHVHTHMFCLFTGTSPLHVHMYASVKFSVCLSKYPYASCYQCI